MNSTVAVLMPGTSSVSCTGFFISPELILSARHCFDPGVETEEDMKLVRAALTEITIQVIRYDSYNSSGTKVKALDTHVARMSSKIAGDIDYMGIEDSDVILLKLDEGQPKSKEYLRIADKTPELGSVVYSVSMPYGQPWIFAQGYVSQYIYDWENFPWVRMLLVSLPVDRGSSGSAIVDNHGRVVGLAHKMDRTAHNAVFVSTDVLKRFVYGFIE